MGHGAWVFRGAMFTAVALLAASALEIAVTRYPRLITINYRWSLQLYTKYISIP